MSNELKDGWGRVIEYLRISVTDRCDFRCVYCMTETMKFMPRDELLTLEEIVEIVHALIPAGLRKVRITGGEPLLRRNVVNLVATLSSLGALREIALTTNGSHLAAYALALRQAGLDSVNISLDSLRPDRFQEITRFGYLPDVLEGLDAARRAGIPRLRINAVIMRGRNDDEIVDLAKFAALHGSDMVYIEEMPLGDITEHDRHALYMSSDEVINVLQQYAGPWLPCSYVTGGPARYFQHAATGQKIGVISPHSHNFCETCNRVRLSAEGRLYLCLGHEHSLDLRAVLREQGAAAILPSVQQALLSKPRRHEFNLEQPVTLRRTMNITGG
ncbi:MAG: GTP 3',8-cyclase MoaA [Pseudomonadales bacterium]|nr:GTP 3',8-cyclase MoaA [Pseudomonadales bacterium]